MHKLARAAGPALSGADLDRLHDPLIAIPRAAILDPAIRRGIRPAVVGLRPGGDAGGHRAGDDPPDDAGSGRRASIAPIVVAATVAIRPATMPTLVMPRIVAADMSRSRRRCVKHSERQRKAGCLRKHSSFSSC